MEVVATEAVVMAVEVTEVVVMEDGPAVVDIVVVAMQEALAGQAVEVVVTEVVVTEVADMVVNHQVGGKFFHSSYKKKHCS